MESRIKIADFFNVSLLSFIENELKIGNTYIIEFSDGKEEEIKDLEAFKKFLENRNIK
ncbi:MAG: hypothetical protein ACOYOV_12395 [Bacteroidales bacterium]